MNKSCGFEVYKVWDMRRRGRGLSLLGAFGQGHMFGMMNERRGYEF
jgi:hypothetical protein